MELKEKHCWAEIDVDAIKSNYKLIKYIMDKPFYTVLKADAYGHGAKYLAKNAKKRYYKLYCVLLCAFYKNVNQF